MSTSSATPLAGDVPAEDLLAITQAELKADLAMDMQPKENP